MATSTDSSNFAGLNCLRTLKASATSYFFSRLIFSAFPEKRFPWFGIYYNSSQFERLGSLLRFKPGTRYRFPKTGIGACPLANFEPHALGGPFDDTHGALQIF